MGKYFRYASDALGACRAPRSWLFAAALSLSGGTPESPLHDPCVLAEPAASFRASSTPSGRGAWAAPFAVCGSA